MNERARSCVYWPGITSDVSSYKKSCITCRENGPSQQRGPPVEAHTPSLPFEAIVADYFKLSGHNYLVIGDRLSGWTEIMKILESSSTSGARGLKAALRQVFARFGVPEEIASDGGPEFVAQETKNFLNSWGVKH